MVGTCRNFIVKWFNGLLEPGAMVTPGAGESTVNAIGVRERYCNPTLFRFAIASPLPGGGSDQSPHNV